MKADNRADSEQGVDFRHDGETGPEQLHRIGAAVDREPGDEPPILKIASTNGAAGGGHQRTGSKPVVALPGGDTTITSTAKNLGELLADTGEFFVRGGSPVQLDHDDDGQPRLKVLRPAALCSDAEQVARLVKKNHTNEGEQTLPANCSETTARLILEAAAFRSALPTIKVVSRSPVLIEQNGTLIQVVGYDAECGILAGGSTVPAISVAEAIERLNELTIDTNFATTGDKARALAAFVTPALLFGGLLGGRAPVDLGEANDSQAGKGYRNKITAAIYNSSIRTVTQRTSGGVGSVQETFDAALVGGACFVGFENFRGRLDIPGIESFLTEDSYPARVPYGSPMQIDPRRIVVMLTSNKAEVTPDFANRSSCVRIIKQPDGYQFRSYPEGDLLDHVRADHTRYLAAVFAVVAEWHRQGKPRLAETRHDFRPWGCVLGWISQNILGAGDLLAGHREAQKRIASPELGWLRDVALAVQTDQKLGFWLRANHILQIILDRSVETTGIDPDVADDGEAWRKANQSIGRKMGKLFRSGDEVTVDNFRVERQQVTDEHFRRTTEYAFSSETR